MRGFVALFAREARDARWHVLASMAIAAAAPWALHGIAMDGADDIFAAEAGGRALVPILFALFAASTASDLVARDVATRRIDALAALPVPVARVWTAKAAFLLVASLLFLAWTLAAECVALAALQPDALAPFARTLGESVPSLVGGLALGAASLFFSTLLERGMAAGLAALVVLVAIVWGVQVAEIPVGGGGIAEAARLAVPLGIAAAFVLASRAAFVRGPIHAATKPRLAVLGVGTALAILVPGGTATALAFDADVTVLPGEGDAARREAFVSPDQKWLAVCEREDGASSTWIVRIADGTCRRAAAGNTWRPHWAAGSSLRVLRSSFSLVESLSHVRLLEIEPTGLGVMENHWLPRYEEREPDALPTEGNWARRANDDLSRRGIISVHWSGGMRRYECASLVISPERDVLFLVTKKGALVRATASKDERTEFLPEGVVSLETSPDGSLVLATTADGLRVLDARTGAVLFAPKDERVKPLAEGRRLLVWSQDATNDVARFGVMDFEAGTRVDLGTPQVASRLPRVTRLRDGRFVVADGDVTLRDAEGRVLSRLYPPASAGETGN